MAKKANIDREKVETEVEIFRAEYPDYTDEHISDYLELCDDFNRAEKDLFAQMLGY